jgi:hypothetical protein
MSNKTLPHKCLICKNVGAKKWNSSEIWLCELHFKRIKVQEELEKKKERGRDR